MSDTDLAMLLALAVAGSLVVPEYWRVNRGMKRPRRLPGEILSTATRHWLDAMIGVALIVAFWWLLIAEYGRDEYRPLWEALPIALICTPPVVLLWELLAAWRLGPAHESATPLADLLLRKGGYNRAALGQAILVLLVRGVFLPINFCVLAHCIAHLRGRELRLLSSSSSSPYETALLVIYALLIAAIVPGYLFGSRLIATHVRRVDTTMLAWTVTLMCYRPLSMVVFGRWLNYRGIANEGTVEKPWLALTSPWPALLGTVGAAIILLEIIHLWGEAVFGLRSSNLSHRGIITHGPYRYSKHPVYVVKCLGWLLIFMPFAMTDAIESIRATLLFSGVCSIYVLRAYCEERLLATDPQYVTYAIGIDKRGVFASIGRMIPWFSFRTRFERWHPDRHAQLVSKKQSLG